MLFVAFTQNWLYISRPQSSCPISPRGFSCARDALKRLTGRAGLSSSVGATAGPPSPTGADGRARSTTRCVNGTVAIGLALLSALLDASGGCGFGGCGGSCFGGALASAPFRVSSAFRRAAASASRRVHCERRVA